MNLERGKDVMEQKKYHRVRWLEEARPCSFGVTWGVPWHKGELNRSQAGAFNLIGPSGGPFGASELANRLLA